MASMRARPVKSDPTGAAGAEEEGRPAVKRQPWTRLNSSTRASASSDRLNRQVLMATVGFVVVVFTALAGAFWIASAPDDDTKYESMPNAPKQPALGSVRAFGPGRHCIVGTGEASVRELGVPTPQERLEHPGPATRGWYVDTQCLDHDGSQVATVASTPDGRTQEVANDPARMAPAVKAGRVVYSLGLDRARDGTVVARFEADVLSRVPDASLVVVEPFVTEAMLQNAIEEAALRDGTVEPADATTLAQQASLQRVAVAASDNDALSLFGAERAGRIGKSAAAAAAAGAEDPTSAGPAGAAALDATGKVGGNTAVAGTKGYTRALDGTIVARTLASVMSTAGHDWIDVIKVSGNGPVLDAFTTDESVRTFLPASQVVVHFTAAGTDAGAGWVPSAEAREGALQRRSAVYEVLLSQGFRVVHDDGHGMRITFAR